jgi:uncharacterized protein (TIGR02271 family)
MRTVIGLFDDHHEALAAFESLAESGFDREALDVLTNDDSADEPKLARMHERVPMPDLEVYLEGVRRGGTLVTATVEDVRVAEASEVMARYAVVNIVQRWEELRAERADLQLSTPGGEEQVLEVIEEQLEIGKQEIERGRLRIYTRVSERNVSEQVSLRDETLRIQRRPVDRRIEINAQTFSSRAFEIGEVDEIAVVHKVARVIEEVRLDKETVEKLETVRATLRRSDVKVGTAPEVADYSAYDAAFQGYHRSSQGSTVGNYAAFEPAFRYGHQLAATEALRTLAWAEIEPDARQLWEEQNPGSWAQFGDSVHYAYETVRGGEQAALKISKDGGDGEVF